MSRARGRAATVVASVAVLVLSACGGGGDGGGGGGGGGEPITVWTVEDLPDRVAATQAIVDRFSQQSGVAVELVSVGEDQFNQLLTSAAAAGELPDVIGSQSLAGVRTLAANQLLDTDSAGAVIEALGADTFDARALELTSDEGTPLAVPSDAWSQLLFYRRDLFEAAGLAPPTTYDDIRAAAQALNQGGVSGFVGATAPGDTFTQQTFEHIALANGCELVDPGGAITINSPQCVAALEFYRDLTTSFGPPGAQDVDTVRASYFAGQAAMAIWSTYLLDELAGLRADAAPSCPECTADPRFLSSNTGIVAAIEGPDGAPAQFGEVSSWTIPVEADAEAAQQFVRFMLSDGYTDWLAIAPEGKYPVRQGSAPGGTDYIDAWETLPIGVDEKAPTGDVYPPEVLEVLTTGPEAFSRWGITQGQGDLIGASLGELPVPEAVAAVTTGGVPPQEAADQAAATLQQILDSLP
jgi:multiple sugar transport system substrate-binding protein